MMSLPSRGLLAAAVCLALAPAAAESQGGDPRIDGTRLLGRLEALASIGRTPEGGVNRVAFSPEDVRAREHVAGLMRGAGLEVRVDAAGNLIGRRGGLEPSRPPIVLGSHLDTVPNGGRFDGALGVLAAIEGLETLREKAVQTRHPVEVVVFADEEGGSIGSRAMAGGLDKADLDAAALSGRTVREGIRILGGAPEKIEAAGRTGERLAAYLELHIEQGGRLEAWGADIGIVEGIVGIRRWEVTILGEANHAGTTPMDARHDALLAAARFVTAVPAAVRSFDGDQVGTVGRIEAEPGAPNVIPGRVRLSLELRDLTEAKIEAMYGRLAKEAEAIADGTGTRFSFAPLGTASAPALSDPRVRACLAGAAAKLGFTSRSLASGAGHDAQNMARLAPMGMVFIPSRGGISHSPKEDSTPEAVVRGADVLLAALLKIDRGGLEKEPGRERPCP